MPTLRERLDRVIKAGGLSTADLSVWFDLPYHTIRNYLEGGEPRPYRRGMIEERLGWLERAVATDPRLPVPALVKLGDRAGYILQVRGSFEGG